MRGRPGLTEATQEINVLIDPPAIASEIKAAPTSNLSAIGSSVWPSSDCWRRVRAKWPSK
jgi:hypothetical protein